MKCVNCNSIKEDFARIRVEIVDKKTRDIIDVVYGSVMCIQCLEKKYKTRDRIRVYI